MELSIDDDAVKVVEELAKKIETAYFWPIYNVWMGTSNTNRGQHDRKWGRGIKWRTFERKTIEDIVEEVIEEEYIYETHMKFSWYQINLTAAIPTAPLMST